MSNNAREAVKKRMMYLKGDDFYFLTYNMLVLASELKCYSQDKRFVDHRKVAFLVSFVSDPRLTQIVMRCNESGKAPGHADRSELAKVYADGCARIHLITRLLFASERKGILALYPGSRKQSIDFSINCDALPEGFLESPIFEIEKTNISQLRTLLPQMRTNKLTSVLERLFVKNGVHVWHD